MLLTSLTSLLLSTLNFLAPPAHDTRASQRPLAVPRTPLQFELRHAHAVTPAAHVYFADAPRDVLRTQGQANAALAVSSRPITTYRPPSAQAFADARVRSRLRQESTALRWDEDEVLGPDVESRETLLTLAKMTSNAYFEPGADGWYDLGGEWVVNDPVGWEQDADGFRGYVFATADNSTIVVSIKGTSTSIGGGGPTTKKDKLNDNLLFSCCCAHVDWTWTTVCDCFRGGWKCDQDCTEQALIDESLFYPVGTNLYYNLTYLYPTSNIWVIGHSLGGSLASLVGTTFGVPVVAFEAPGEKMAAQRLHLPAPPSLHHVTHVFHTADPIPMGVCNGVFSSCAIGGYALESRCHLGKVIQYDTVNNLSWAVDVRTHPIARVVEGVLSEPWADAQAVGREVPEAFVQEDCVDCYTWEYGNFTK
ncbi:alpha/beta-hydrolase [Auriscalpium vulgare]|uniref:Alpha/beta-hydrolase n=1 Tax=Auriscalpium vulgare TaxID=40419 RepID=A0ACB8S7A2_9AGAM|nr:alpha/beta-hydrolase [Auriscalpium vulgare]